jgi:hypothetical protein
VGAGEHVDAVDLVEREALDRLMEVPPIDDGWTRRTEALSGESDPPRRFDRYPLFPHSRGR